MITNLRNICLIRIFTPAFAVIVFAGCSASRNGSSFVGNPELCPDCTECEIRGTVTDKDSSQPINAIVTATGTMIWGAADSLGRFSLSLPSGTHVLRIAYPGYYQHEVSVVLSRSQRRRVDVQLEANNEPTEWKEYP